MRPLALLAAILLAPLTAAAQSTCWRPGSPERCTHTVVTDFGFAYWANPTSARFDAGRSRVVLSGSFGYLRAVGARDAAGVTLDAVYYNRRERYAGIEWLYPQVAAHAMARWDHWLGESVALRAGVGTPIAGTHLDGDVAFPGLDVELGALWAGKLGLTVRMERQRLDYRSFAYPAVPGFTYPLGNVGLTPYTTSTARTDWYVGLTTHGWTGLTGFGAVTLMALFSALTYSS